jgi:hypothetical protein
MIDDVAEVEGFLANEMDEAEREQAKIAVSAGNPSLKRRVS